MWTLTLMLPQCVVYLEQQYASNVVIARGRGALSQWITAPCLSLQHVSKLRTASERVAFLPAIATCQMVLDFVRFS